MLRAISAMLSHRAVVATTIVAATLFVLPVHAASSNSRLVEAAQREGKVVVYSVLSTRAAQPLILDFESIYPGIKVHYDGDKGSNDMDARFRRERAEGDPSADVIWSSAMDMQMQLVKEGHAARHASPEARKLPRGADYRSLAYGTTLEPVVFVYNKQLLTGADIPRNRDDFAALIRKQRVRFAGKVTGFDLRKSGVGYMFAVQDHANHPRHKELLAAFGMVDFRPSGGTGDMLVGINQGKYLLGYNMMGAYALSRSKKDLPHLGVVYPDDYTLALSRVVIINKAAAHPNAARLWLDYMLSARGQKVMGDAMELYPIRNDVDAAFTAAGLRRDLGAPPTSDPDRHAACRCA